MLIRREKLATAMVRVLNHELPPSQAFTPTFALATLAQALRHGRGHRREIVREAGTIAVEELRRGRWKASPHPAR